jgi:thioredoxin 2
MAGSHVVCPSCGRINRLPDGRNAAAAKCGTCHAGLFQGKPVAVDAAGFDRHAAKDDIPALVDIWAPWCGPCRAMGPMFERAAAELEPDVRLLKLNADEAPEISARFQVQAIPTMLLLQSGRLLARNSGAMDANRIVAWTRSHLR